MTGKMPGFFGNLARTLSEELKTYTQTHRTSSLKAAPSFNDFQTQVGDDVVEALECQDSMKTPDSPSARPAQVPRAGSLASDSMMSVDGSAANSPVGTPTSSLADAHAANDPIAVPQRKRRDYKIQGMDAYDYWCLIRSL